jgi:hypothetical protein
MPLRPFARAAATSPADSDEFPLPCFSHHTALVLCYGDAEVPLQHPSVSCLPSSTSHYLNLPRRVATEADALSGMVNTNLLLLLHPVFPPPMPLPLFNPSCLAGWQPWSILPSTDNIRLLLLVRGAMAAKCARGQTRHTAVVVDNTR